MLDYPSLLNPSQLEAVTYGNGPVLVLAGAGTGKTRTLCFRVAYLLEEKHIAPENIMLATFTNKAAKEMLERVEQYVGRPVPKLWGGTFHHLGNRILRQYGRAIGLEPDFTILDEEESVSFLKDIYKELEISITFFRL